MTIKTKKRIATVLGLLFFLLAYGFIGSCDLGTIPIKTGFVLSALCEVVGAFLLWKAGVVRI